MRATSFLAFAVYLAFTQNAFAYLDPGTGSILLQGIIGTIAGILVFGRLYWAKLKNVLARVTSFGRDADRS
jgi:hypothetical protein